MPNNIWVYSPGRLAAKRRTISLLLSVSLALSACGGPNEKGSSQAPTKQEQIQQLQIVDCLLPGQVRRLGQSTYLTPRRPARTTASDCSIRGGEYVAYDRADYKTALNVWMAAANGGDEEAQANVGEIFERGLGGEANYEMAAFWYKKAADQGNSRAQYNLGTLYEQGLGFEKNKLMAMNYYRQAWGMEEDSIIFKSAADTAQNELRAQLAQQLASKEGQIGALSQQITSLQEQAKEKTLNVAGQQNLNTLLALVTDLDQQRRSTLDEMNLLPRLRKPAAKPAMHVESSKQPDSISLADMKFGKYYALIIANQNYDSIEDLKTPHGDALRAKALLEERYGFNVTVLLDADSATVMKKINEFSGKLKEQDNLLIFYAGHGSRIRSGDYEAGYWLPVDAEPPPEDTFWVSNEFVTRHLARLKAKRVLVVADSCYAGLLSNAPDYLFMGDETTYSEEYIRYKLPKKSRLLISSGGDQPVLDNADQGASIFARAFLDALEQNEGILSGPELFLKIRTQVNTRAKSLGLDQQPELKVIKGAGHEVGDFFFVNQS
ncbi:MAG: hypothetical protein ACI93R_003744 [Flavobacteriales bacterium]|jgi:hypothetical protein